MRLFPFSPVAVAKDRHRGSEGRICTLSRICTLPSSPKLLRTLFAVLAGPEWRVNGGYLEAERHVHGVECERRTEMEKSGGKGEFAIPGSTNSIRFTEQKQLAKLAKLLRDTRCCYYATPTQTLVVGWWRSTHDSLNTSSRSWTPGILGRYVDIMMARKDTWRIERKIYDLLLHV